MLTADDADYLKQYLAICENTSSRYEADALIRKLNAEYDSRLSEGVGRSEPLETGYERLNDHWSSSGCSGDY